MTLSRSLFAALLIGSPAASQELVGFDLSSFGKTVLSTNQSAGDVVLEAAFGAYNNEFISAYSPKSVFAKMGRAVGRLDVATDAGVFPCTAFLVDDDLLMTNHHCVPGIVDNPRAGANAIVGVQFVAGYLNEGIEEGSERFIVNPIPVETSKPLDYTLLRIVGAKPGLKFGKLALAGDAPDDNSPFWIIGHPMGEAQRISREKCRANAPALSKDRVLHTCDTMPGNSGSPVIDAGTQQVIALHHAGSARNSINYAVPMSAILNNSSVLKPVVVPAPAKPDRDAQADRALARLFGVQDDVELQTGLKKLIIDFPGTTAARSAQRRLDGLKSTRDAARDRAQLAKANEALLAALVLTDTAAQRRALEALLRTHGGTPAANAARATLATLSKPPPVTPTPVVRKPDPKGPTAQPKSPDPSFVNSAPSGRMIHAPGTVLKTGYLTVRKAPTGSARVVTSVFGRVTVGEYVRDDWYAVAGQPQQFVKIPDGTKVISVVATQDQRRLPDGAQVPVNSLPAYSAPSETAGKVKTLSSIARIDGHVKGGWYRLQGTPVAYVKPTATNIAAFFANPIVKPADKPAKIKPSTTGKDQIFTAGTIVKTGTRPVRDHPISYLPVVSHVTGQVKIGSHVFGDWYTLHSDKDRFVELPQGLRIVSGGTEDK